MATNVGITNPNLYDILRRRLPEDIIYEILFIRLSVKDLLRLKSVCKSWLSLISSPNFIKIHHSKLTNDLDLSRHHLILSRKNNLDVHLRDAYLGFQSCSLKSLLEKPPIDTIWLDYPDNIVRFVGYCNGLVCLVCDCNNNINNFVMLWNPSTRKSRRLPRPHKNFGNPCKRYIYGFCYDESDDDFKVFVVHGCRANEYKVSVYCSKSDNWSMNEDFPFKVLSEGNYANGSMYWLVGTSDMNYDDQKPEIIVSMNLKADTFREIVQPDYGEGAYDWSLGTFGDRLSILCKFENHADFWVMKECGVEKFWIKLFTIPYMDILTRGKDVKPICISVNGDILVNFDSTILVYNSKDKTFKNLLHNYYGEKLDVYTYVESLILP